jgi:hypothetical protein
LWFIGNKLENHHVIAFGFEKENYANLKKIMVESGIEDEMKQIQREGIRIGGDVKKVVFILCCDWGCLAKCQSRSTPSSESFCIWCECKKTEIGRDKEWSISNIVSHIHFPPQKNLCFFIHYKLNFIFIFTTCDFFFFSVAEYLRRPSVPSGCREHVY